MFGKDIDEFLEDSEWDIESIDKMSQFSKNSKNTIRSADQKNKLRGLEKVYLKRIEGGTTMNAQTSQQQPKSQKKGKFRDQSSPREPPRARQAWDQDSRGSKNTSNIGKKF